MEGGTGDKETPQPPTGAWPAEVWLAGEEPKEEDQAEHAEGNLMDKPHLARRARWAASVVAVAGFAGCGGSLSGQYADASGLMKFNFKAGRKVES